MAKTEKIPNSQQIDLPWDVVQQYFKEQQAEEKKKRILLWGGLALLLIGLAAAIALPFLIPTLFTTLGVFFPWFLLTAGLLPTFSMLYGRFSFRTLFRYHKTDLREDSVHITSSEKYRYFNRYTLSKGEAIKNDQSCTIFSIKLENNSIEKQIKLFHGVLQGSSLLLSDMEHEIEIKQKVLERQQDALKYKISNLTNENKIISLRQKLNLIEQKINDYDKLISLITNAKKSLYTKDLLTGHACKPLKNLHSALIENKDITEAFLKIEEKKAYLRGNRFWAEETPIIEEVIQEMDVFIRLMLRASIETNLKGRLIEDSSCYAIYFKYLPEEMTAHFSHLLKNKALQYRCLKILDDLLINHPDSADPINQTTHYILANHFYREFKHNKTKKITEKCCFHALKLNSSDENNTSHVANAGFKRTVIEAAFFFNEKHDMGLLSEEAVGLLRYSHENPHAYEDIKKCIQEQTSPPPAPVQFSKSKPNLGALDLSELDKTPSTSLSTPKKS